MRKKRNEDEQELGSGESSWKNRKLQWKRMNLLSMMRLGMLSGSSFRNSRNIFMAEELKRRRAELRARALIKEEEEFTKPEEAEEDEENEEESSEEESEESEDDTVPRMKPVFVEKYNHYA
ncbi:unnamed protein product [Gongylonema pulchrum]|uniref:MFAP1 domain-containing protein n=1 Tax=Gongylonema pulchrum TaxID=637853 RepID=A0A183DM74_9BILA|nr:unnamed protein product [Gongylonema pulchrum]